MGRETLSLTTEGRLFYQRKHRGQVWQQQTNIESQVQSTLKAALADINIASTSKQQHPPGASLVQIRYEDQLVTVDYHQGKTLPGYKQIIKIMDAYVQAFRQVEK